MTLAFFGWFLGLLATAQAQVQDAGQVEYNQSAPAAVQALAPFLNISMDLTAFTINDSPSLALPAPPASSSDEASTDDNEMDEVAILLEGIDDGKDLPRF